MAGRRDIGAAFSAEIMKAIRGVSPDLFETGELANSLMIITAMVLLTSGEGSWSEENVETLGAAYSRGLMITLKNMAEAQRNGLILPFQKTDELKH